MKQLLYIGRPNLGENMFATPCLELLSKQYEITFLAPAHTIPVFTKYKFLKQVLPGCNHGDKNSKLALSTRVIINNLLKNGEWYYAYHNDHDVLFLPNQPELLQIKKYPVLHDRDIKIYSNSYEQSTILNTGNKTINSGYFLSRTKKYMLKLQLLTLEQTMDFDCTVRCPTFIPEKRNDIVVVYQGSKECLRKLPDETINKFTKVLPDAMYLVTQETADKLEFKKNNIKYIQTSNFIADSLKQIIKLFESGPKVMIGPDSGLTQLATGYKIPLIWLQSRIVPENVIDAQYKDLIKVYIKEQLNCKKECLGCAATEALKTNTLQYGLFHVDKLLKHHKNMDCFINAKPDCLSYEDSDIAEIIKLCNE